MTNSILLSNHKKSYTTRQQTEHITLILGVQPITPDHDSECEKCIEPECHSFSETTDYEKTEDEETMSQMNQKSGVGDAVEYDVIIGKDTVKNPVSSEEIYDVVMNPQTNRNETVIQVAQEYAVVALPTTAEGPSCTKEEDGAISSECEEENCRPTTQSPKPQPPDLDSIEEIYVEVESYGPKDRVIDKEADDAATTKVPQIAEGEELYDTAVNSGSRVKKQRNTEEREVEEIYDVAMSKLATRNNNQDPVVPRVAAYAVCTVPMPTVPPHVDAYAVCTLPAISKELGKLVV